MEVHRRGEEQVDVLVDALDAEGDPHSPRDGVWWAHLLWWMPYVPSLDEPSRYGRYVVDLDRDPVHRVLQRCHILFPLTLGGLLKHMAINEDFITTQKLSGAPVGEPWESLWDGTDDWEFTSAANDTPGRLYTFWDDAVERSRARLDAAMARGGLDQLVHVSSPDGEHASLRRLLCDLIEEYGRHTGHADLLREAVDGRVGEDPPPGWRPVSNR